MSSRPGLLILCLMARLAVPGVLLTAGTAVGEPTAWRCPTASVQTSCLPPRAADALFDRSGQQAARPASLVAAPTAWPPTHRVAMRMPLRSPLDPLRRWQRRALRRTVDDPPA